MKRQGRPAVYLDPNQIAAMLDKGMNFAEIRRVVKCGHKRLKECIAEHGLSVSDSPQLAAARMRGFILSASGLGGDKALRELMRGRTFDRLLMTGDFRAPVHVPHSTPGDGRSGCGNSFDGIGHTNKNPALYTEISAPGDDFSGCGGSL